MSDELNVGYVVLLRKSMYSRGLSNWKPSARWVKRPVGGDIYEVYHRPELTGEESELVAN